MLPHEPLPQTRKHAPARGLLEESPAVQLLLERMGSDAAVAKLLADDTIDRLAPARGRGHHMRRAVALAAPGSATRAHLLAQYLQVVAAAGVLLSSAPSSSLQLASRDQLFEALQEAETRSSYSTLWDPNM